MTRTLTYIILAVVMAALAAWKGMPDPEINATQFSETGQEYYPDFVNPNEATGIRVVVFDEKTSDIKSFEVQQKNGLWKIPSHYDYPVDGKEQLAKTAASLIGVNRGAVAGESEVDFKRLGVIDPLTDDDAMREFSGERLTLTKNETVLVDLIIGKEVPDRAGFHYVRKPDEKLTYIAELKIELTTKFGDWIEPDLLQLDQNKIRQIDVRDYSVDEQRGAILFGDSFDLKREGSSDPWSLNLFDPKTNKIAETITDLKAAEVNEMLTALGDLKIAGVRRKPDFISSDLKLTGDVTPSRQSISLFSRLGYHFVPNQEKRIYEIFSNQGDLTAITEDGVAYVLRFGAVFTGNEFDIEVGSVTSEKEKKEEQKKDDKPIITPASESGDLKASRYLFVSVQFDPSAFGDAPVEPTPPTKKKEGKETEEPKKTDEKSEEKKEPEATSEKSKKPVEEKEVSEKKSGEKKETDEEPIEKVDPQKVYEAALIQYKADLATYQEKIAAGKKQVAKLNERFADWYYVIDAASFDTLNKSRDDLVEVKEPAPAQPPETPTETPTEPSKTTEPPKSAPEKTSEPTSKEPVSNKKPEPEVKEQPAPASKEPAPQ